MNLLTLIISSFACFRITYMITEEEGPWEIFEKIREKLKYMPWSPLHCFYCTSVWVAIMVGTLMSLAWIEIPAISGIAIIIYRIHEIIDSYELQLYED